MRSLRKNRPSSDDKYHARQADILEYKEVSEKIIKVLGEMERLNAPLGARLRHYFTFRRADVRERE